MAKEFPNKFPGSCKNCGSHVPAQAGICRRGTSGWEITCGPCESGEIVEVPVARPTFNPTDEQLIAKAKFIAGESFALEAFAGAGKTSTFVLLANSTDRRGQYIAYNAAIAAEAGAKFPKTCASATLHALARRQIGHHYSARLDAKAPRQSATQIAKHLGIEPFFYTLHGEDRVVQPKTLAGYVQKAIQWFCTTADTVPSVKHVQAVDGIDEVDADTGKRSWTNQNALAAHIADAIDRAWDDIVDTDGVLRFNHDYYLKIWELGLRGEPKIPGEYILFDEAQDANPVFISAVQKQGVQTVWCGDSNQAIYGWRGAVDALKQVEVDSRAFLTQSFRFGPEIAEIANKILALVEDYDPEHPLQGAGKPGTVGPCDAPDAVLCRTNAGAISVVLDAARDGKSTFLVGGGGEVASFAKAAQELQTKGSTAHPELSIFTSWTEVQDFVANDPQGDELKLLVKLIDDFGAADILRAASNDTTEADADLVVSTAHKSKGREWDAVRLHSDFPESTDNDEALFLIYVAATRAKLHLDYTGCAPILSILGEKEDV